jgi:CRP/FNR family transcriptional regulator
MTNTIENINICHHCANKKSCDLGAEFFSGLPKTISIVEKGANLFNEGDEFSGFYIVCEGIVKATTPNNYSSTINFYYPGDVIGLCGLSDGRYKESVRLLNSGRMFKIAQQDLKHAMQNEPEFADKMLKLLGKTLVKKQNSCHVNILEAETRLFIFLKEQGVRSQTLAKDKSFTLQMTRSDIANHLGIAVETLSRLMRKLSYKGLIAFDNKRVALLDNEDFHTKLLPN